MITVFNMINHKNSTNTKICQIKTFKNKNNENMFLLKNRKKHKNVFYNYGADRRTDRHDDQNTPHP